MQKLTITGIATLVAAAAFASTAAAEITKPGPGFLGPPVVSPQPTAPLPGQPTGPVKLGPPPTKPKLTAPAPIGKPTLSIKKVRIPAF